VHQLLLVGIVTVGNGGGDPALESGDLLVAMGQCADGDKDAAQVFDGLAGRQFVEGGVSDFGRGVPVLQDRGGAALGEPARDRIGPLGGREGGPKR
jgi:hypothetical protein